MYEILKSIAKKIAPDLLYSQEETFRKVLAWKYRGSSYNCNICKTKLSSFIKRDNGDRLCPRCGSVGRTRRLFSLFSDSGKKMRVLHFSPPKALKNQLQTFDTFHYKTTDYEGEFEADYSYDITDIDCQSNQYDLIICYHVLEHIVQDSKAMSELYRILDQDGKVYIQTPFTNGMLMEDYSISSKKDRLIHYGQDDHVRIYNIQTIVERLEGVGFDVDVHEYKEKIENYNGYKVQEYVLIAQKN